MISLDDIIKQISLEKVTLDETKKAVRQFQRRRSKMHRNKMGDQNAWMLTLIDVQPQESFVSGQLWIIEQFKKLVPAMPNSAYKAIIAFISQSTESPDHFSHENGLSTFSTSEGLRVLLFPKSGIVAFKAPPGNLKRSLEYNGFLCEWNWSIESSLFRDEESGAILGEEQFDLFEYQEMARIHRKYGRGRGSTIAIIDCGVCKESRQLNDRMIWQGELFKDMYGDEIRIRTARNDFSPKTDHGTQVASLAAGETIGIAPEAEVISFAMPMKKKMRFNQLALYVALETIRDDNGLALGGVPLKTKIDTLLIPAGIFGVKPKGKEFRDRSIKSLLMNLNDDSNICIVAAIGNKPKKAAFPSTFQFVHAVGYLNDEGHRHTNSGYLKDTTGSPLPNVSVIGENLAAEGKNGIIYSVSGSSFSTSIIAGYFSLLANNYRSSSSRADQFYTAIYVDKDQIGELRKLHTNQF